MHKHRAIGLVIVACLIPQFAFATNCYGVKEDKDGIILATDILEGYTDQTSYNPGDVVKLRVNSFKVTTPTGDDLPSPATFPTVPQNSTYTAELKANYAAKTKSFVVDLIRYNGFKEETLLDKLTITPPAKSVDFDRASHASESPVDFETEHQYILPVTATPGLYGFYLTQGGCETYATFVVKATEDPNQNSGKGLLVLASSNTWQAYNTWGGSSFYKTRQADAYKPLRQVTTCDTNFDAANGGCNNFVTYLRPNVHTPDNLDNHLMGGERHVLEWLRVNNIPYNMISDFDFDFNPGILIGYDAVIVSTHGEYWSKKMYEGMQEYINLHNGNLIYLSGNGIYWKVSLDGYELEVQKYQPGNTTPGDPFFSHKVGADGNVAGGPGGGRIQDASTDFGPETELTGVKYNKGDAAANFAPFKVRPGQSDHWIYECTNLNDGDHFAQWHSGKANCDLDEYLLDNTHCGQGGSGWETDIKDPHTPEGSVHLAKGMNMGLPKPDGSAKRINGADMIYYDVASESGGGVFSIGSLNIGRSLSLPDQNYKLNRILINVMTEFGVIEKRACGRARDLILGSIN